MKLDDYLEKHQHPGFDAVLEPIVGDPTRVRLTPVLQSRGCECDRSIVIEKSQIADVDPTGRTLLCCGRLHRVVHVTLSIGATIPAMDAVVAMMARSSDPTDPANCHEEAIWQFKRCQNGCLGSADPEKCREKCRARLARELEVCESS